MLSNPAKNSGLWDLAVKDGGSQKHIEEYLVGLRPESDSGRYIKGNLSFQERRYPRNIQDFVCGSI